MNSKEKLVNVIKKLIQKERPPMIEIGEMTAENKVKIKDLEIESDMLFFIETCTVDINTLLGLTGTVAVGGGGESPHSHGWSFTDTSTYIKKLKAGDKVAVYKLNKGNFLILGKVVSL